MDELIEQFRALLQRLSKVDPKLHREMIALLKKIQKRYSVQFGRPAFLDWIDPFKPPRPGGRPRRGGPG